MLSPAKAITAGALVFAIGGAFLIAQPFEQQASVPGAETDAAAVPATWVTGEYTHAPTCKYPTSEIDGVVHHMWGADCDPQIWTTSDPRLTGTAAAFWNADVYEPGADVFKGDLATNISVITGEYHVRNEAGGWECRTNHLVHGYGWYPTAETGETAMCVGNGENEGLSAILVLDGPAGPKSVVGLIFPGDAPPPPERPAAE